MWEEGRKRLWSCCFARDDHTAVREPHWHGVPSAERTALEPLVRVPPRVGFFDEHKGMLSSSWDGIVAESSVCAAVGEHLANYGAMDIVAKA